MGGLAVLLHDVPASSERSFCISAVCVAATVKGVRWHHDVASVAGSSPESCKGSGWGEELPGFAGPATLRAPACTVSALPTAQTSTLPSAERHSVDNRKLPAAHAKTIGPK
jgi:hypothetical protein